MLVSLYTVRVVLNVLGAEDYGIYNVVAGVVTMFSFLSGAMATASQRYFSFDLGKGDTEHLKTTFSVTFTIYAFITILVILLSETVGLWFVVKKLSVPVERISSVRWIYQFSVLSFVFTILTGPFMADIIAHEDMNIYACVSIIEVMLRLAIVFLVKLFKIDHLFFYGLLMMCVTIINTSIYRTVCRIKYPECKYRFCWDKKYLKEMFSFTGWTIFGSFTSVVRMQALTILINQFFNPVVAAARSIAIQVKNALNTFSANFNTSLYAPIIKEYASDNINEVYSLVCSGCKITYFLMWIFSLPLCLRMEYVLTLWLKELPDSVVIFTQLSVIECLINSISYPVATSARAPGRMALYEGTLGALQLVIFITSWILIKFFEGKAVVVFYVAIVITVIMFFVRLLIVKKMIGLPLRMYAIRTCMPILFITLISYLPMFFLNKVVPKTFLGFCLIFICSLLISSITMWFVGLDKDWQSRIKKMVSAKVRRFQ
mgnify:CR=1 FL=1